MLRVVYSLPCVAFFWNVHIAVFTLVAGPLGRCQCSEGPATDHLDTGFLSWFPCDLKQMLRWFPNMQDVTTCFSCSRTEVNVNFSSTVSSTSICVQNHCHRANGTIAVK